MTLQEKLVQEIGAFPGGLKEVIKGLELCIEVADEDQQRFFEVLLLDIIAVHKVKDLKAEREAILFKENSKEALKHLQYMEHTHGCQTCKFLIGLKEKEMKWVAGIKVMNSSKKTA